MSRGIAINGIFLLGACGSPTAPNDGALSTQMASTSAPPGSSLPPPGDSLASGTPTPTAPGSGPPGAPPPTTSTSESMSGAGGLGAGGAGGGLNAGGTGGAGGAAPTSSMLVLSSPAFDAVDGCSESNAAVCDVFPDEHISYMEQPNISPELVWEGVPEGTRSFAVTFSDLSFGQPHWAIWNIPGDQTGLPADLPKDTAMPAVPAGAVQSNATFAEGEGYFGPQAACNVYQFELFALSLDSFSPEQPEFVALVRTELEGLGEAILGRATLTARADYLMMCE